MTLYTRQHGRIRVQHTERTPRTSNTRDIVLVRGILSPLMSVRILLSSITLFMLSIHRASTGPSNTIHFSHTLVSSAQDLKIVLRMPSAHSKVDRSYAPYSSFRVMLLGL